MKNNQLQQTKIVVANNADIDDFSDVKIKKKQIKPNNYSPPQNRSQYFQDDLFISNHKEVPFNYIKPEKDVKMPPPPNTRPTGEFQKQSYAGARKSVPMDNFPPIKKVRTEDSNMNSYKTVDIENDKGSPKLQTSQDASRVINEEMIKMRIEKMDTSKIARYIPKEPLSKDKIAMLGENKEDLNKQILEKLDEKFVEEKRTLKSRIAEYTEKYKNVGVVEFKIHEEFDQMDVFKGKIDCSQYPKNILDFI